MARKQVHVACIMDGNGRWARKRGLPRTAGHTAGEETLSDVVRAASKREIDYLTVFENSGLCAACNPKGDPRHSKKYRNGFDGGI